jgi:hypothetical protein
MRLAQLARKLSVRPSEIVDLLSKDQVFFEDGSNAKLNDDLVRRVVLHFAPERLSEIMLVQTSEVIETNEPNKSNELESKPETTSEPAIEIKTEAIAEVVDPTTVTDLPETIRVPKVELAGLKVLGKIELPQPRLKDENKDEVKDTNEVRAKRERKETQPRRHREERPWRNPVALQREAEVREREERRLEALKQEKERKRQHYLSQVKNSKPPKAMRIYEESAPVPTPVAEQKPRTWIGKFLRWLNNK